MTPIEKELEVLRRAKVVRFAKPAELADLVRSGTVSKSYAEGLKQRTYVLNNGKIVWFNLHDDDEDLDVLGSLNGGSYWYVFEGGESGHSESEQNSKFCLMRIMPDEDGEAPIH